MLLFHAFGEQVQLIYSPEGDQAGQLLPRLPAPISGKQDMLYNRSQDLGTSLDPTLSDLSVSLLRHHVLIFSSVNRYQLVHAQTAADCGFPNLLSEALTLLTDLLQLPAYTPPVDGDTLARQVGPMLTFSPTANNADEWYAHLASVPVALTTIDASLGHLQGSLPEVIKAAGWDPVHWITQVVNTSDDIVFQEQYGSHAYLNHCDDQHPGDQYGTLQWTLEHPIIEQDSPPELTWGAFGFHRFATVDAMTNRASLYLVADTTSSVENITHSTVGSGAILQLALLLQCAKSSGLTDSKTFLLADIT